MALAPFVSAAEPFSLEQLPPSPAPSTFDRLRAATLILTCCSSCLHFFGTQAFCCPLSSHNKRRNTNSLSFDNFLSTRRSFLHATRPLVSLRFPPLDTLRPVKRRKRRNLNKRPHRTKKRSHDVFATARLLNCCLYYSHERVSFLCTTKSIQISATRNSDHRPDTVKSAFLRFRNCSAISRRNSICLPAG